MKILLFLSLAGGLAFGASEIAPPVRTANPKANARAKAVLAYLTALEKRPDKRLLSGQFSNFGNGANLGVMERIHEVTGHWPAILDPDFSAT